MEPKRYFLIVSNMRCGSTLTQFMLGVLPSVATDFEIKWKPVYAPQPIHLVIDENTVSLRKRLSEVIKPSAVIGSKLVLDFQTHPPGEYHSLRRTIDPEMAIIHLKRRYFDILASSLRGFIHLPNDEGNLQDSKAYNMLREAKQKALEKVSHVIKKGTVDENALRAQLKTLLRHDLEMLKLMDSHPYLLVRYQRITSSLKRISRHIGVVASNKQIEDIAANPPLEKLPPITFKGNFLGLKIHAAGYDLIFWLHVIFRCLYVNIKRLRSRDAVHPQ